VVEVRVVITVEVRFWGWVRVGVKVIFSVKMKSGSGVVMRI